MKRLGLLISFFVLHNLSVAQVLATAKKDGKWGFIDLIGEWYISPDFDSVDNFYNSYATFVKGKKQGLIDYKGKVVVKPKYDFVGLVDDGMVDILENDEMGFINVKTGFVIKPQFEDSWEFSEGLAPVMNKNEKWGFINKSGAVVIPYQYDDVDGFVDGICIVEIEFEKYMIDKSGHTLCKIPEPDYKSSVISREEKIQRIKTANPDLSNRPVITYTYLQDSIFWFGLDNKYGIADTNGRIILQAKFDYAWYFSEGLAPVRQGSQWGFVFPDGEVAIELRFEEVKNFKYGLAAAKSNGLWGYIDHSGNWRIEPKFEDTDGNFRDIKATFDPIYYFER